MKKFIIVTLMAGFLTAQAPVKALNTVNHEALALAQAAQEVAVKAGVNKAQALAGLKKVCAKTSVARKAMNVLVNKYTIGATGLTLAGLAYTYGIPVEALTEYACHYAGTFCQVVPEVVTEVVTEITPEPTLLPNITETLSTGFWGAFGYTS